jgi:uncharacterized repeat protein (TIGR02543 family)
VFVNENYGGSQDVYLKHVVVGKAFNSGGNLPKPVREGYTFGGWFKKNAAGVLSTKVTNTTKMSGNSAVALYAKWTAKKVTVKMNLNQKSTDPALKNTTKTVSVNYGSPYANLAIPALAGEKFVGWAFDKEGLTKAGASVEPGVDAKGVPKSVTIYAQYEPLGNPDNEYTVKLDPNGGYVDAASILVAYRKNPQMKYSGLGYYDKGKDAEPVRTGYTFAGWYTKKTGGTKVTANTKVTKFVDHTLYARWTAKKYWVAFDLNGGKAGGKTQVSPKRYAYGAKYSSLPAPAKTGHKFLGWYMDTGDSGSKVTSSGKVADYGAWLVSESDSTSTKAANAMPTVTLTALYAPVTSKATFDANGGHFGVAAVKTMRLGETYGGAYNLPPTPVRSGYIFKGWYTGKTGGSIIDAGNVKLTKDTTLYARWVKG